MGKRALSRIDDEFSSSWVDTAKFCEHARQDSPVWLLDARSSDSLKNTPNESANRQASDP